MEPTPTELAQALSRNSRDVGALFRLGRLHAAAGRSAEAEACFTRVLALQPQHAYALLDLGITLALAGRCREAQVILVRAKAAGADAAPVHMGLGICELELGELAPAEANLREALRLNPRLSDAANNLGVTLDRLGRLQEAAECFRQATRINPNYSSPYENLGGVLLRAGQWAEAAAAFRQLTELDPQNAAAHAHLGETLLAAGDLFAAQQSLRRALSLDPTLHEAAANLGESHRMMQDLDAAETAFRQALTARPNFADAYFGLARVAVAQNRNSEAHASLKLAASLGPSDARLILAVAATLNRIGRGNEALAALHECVAANPANRELLGAQIDLAQRLDSPERALEALDQLIGLAPEQQDLILRRAGILESQGRYTEAIEQLQALPKDVSPAQTCAALLSCALRICDWSLAEQCWSQLRVMPDGPAHLHPFLLLATESEPAEQFASMRAHAARFAQPPRASAPRRDAHSRLRIAYLSPDFGDHPVAYAVTALIEKHDRRRFLPVGVALTPPKPEGTGGRFRNAFEDFIDVSQLSDGAIAQLLEEREIDIAVDLGGYTAGSRPGILALRPAGVQINYLGFAGTMGADFMDFIIADKVVLPETDEGWYAERVLRMPDCYLPFDDSRHVDAGRVRRAEEGLPDDAFVLCAFNNPYKITRSMFSLWIRLLLEIPNGVLWLRSMPAAAAANLRRAATEQGVSDARLVFAAYQPQMDLHLARLRLADLFLDTLPFNAHTTAAESLWMGVPVLSCAGRTFAGRVGASVLRAAGIEELVCADLDDYFARTLELARDPSALQALRGRLLDSRALPLFNTERYTRDLEALLEQAARLERA